MIDLFDAQSTEVSLFNSLDEPQPKLLLVDDKEANLFATSRLLKALDVEVITATSGAEALSLTLRHDFALILIDVQMPIMNGFETADYLRENEDTRHVPIIFVTAISKEDRYVNQGYEVGAVDYIFKPVDGPILLSKVSVFLELHKKKLRLKRSLSALQELKQRYLMLLEAASDGILGVDSKGVINFANPAALSLLNVPSRLIGQSIIPFLQGVGADDSQWQQHDFYYACIEQQRVRQDNAILYRYDGEELPVQISFSPLNPAQGLCGGVLMFQDITLRKKLQEKLLLLAQFDQLTGLPNRHTLFEHINRILAKAQRQKTLCALLFMDLDGFKQINDEYGHAMGDYLLKSFAGRVKDKLRGGDILARLAGDEFVVVVDDASSSLDVEHIAAKLIDACAGAYELDQTSINVHCSIGIALVENGQGDAEGLLHLADEAMYRAKANGKNQYSL